MNTKTKYIALLRGINVGGHHKVSMSQLSLEMEALGFENIITILNSGNVIFEAPENNEATLEELISTHLEETFGFPVPVLIREKKVLLDLIKKNPFQHVEVNKDIRLYVSFLKEKTEVSIKLPWTSADDSFRIPEIYDRAVCSVLDISKTKTTESMNMLEKLFGKNITTRNWNTVMNIASKI